MAEMIDQGTPAETSTAQETDLVAAIKRVLEASSEPLTPAKIRASLPSALRSVSPETLQETLDRQVTANVLYRYPRYRSQQDRYWDRPMEVHVAHLLRSAVHQNPMAIPDLRRKLPDYARGQVEPVIEQEVTRGTLHRHPPLTKRTGPRYGTQTPDPKEFLRPELTNLFRRLGQLGFSQNQLREGALELLHEEEWASTEPVAAPEGVTPGPRPTEAETESEAPLAGTAETSLAATGEAPRETPPPPPEMRPPQHPEQQP